MKSVAKGPQTYLLLLRAASLLIPAEMKSEWRREWEAEVIYRWLLLKKRGTLNRQTKVDLWKRVRGAVLDALWFQRAHLLRGGFEMVLAILTILVGLVTGFGAGQEFIVRGVIDRELQPLIIGVVGIVIAVLFLISGIARWRKSVRTRPLLIVTAILSIVFHIYAVLPPHRNMGWPAFIVGVGYGLFLLIVVFSSKRNQTATAIS